MSHTLNNNGVITVYETLAEYQAAVAAIQAAAPPIPPDVQFMRDQTKTEYVDEDADGFVQLKPRFANVVCVSAPAPATPTTIDVASFPIPQNILGKTRIEVYIVDAVNGAFGIADITVSWRRFANGVAIGSAHPIIPLQTPGTLNGASLPALVVSGNNIISRFTGVANRTINVYVKFSPTVLKF